MFAGSKYVGIVSGNDNYWREQRRFALHIFRDFGVGKNLMQEKILDEMAFMIKNLKNGCKNDVQPNIVDIGDHFDICIGSIINNLLFGYRFDEVSHTEMNRQ